MQDLPSRDELEEVKRENSVLNPAVILKAAQNENSKITYTTEDSIEQIRDKLQKKAMAYAENALDVIIAAVLSEHIAGTPAARLKAAEKVLEIVAGRRMETLQQPKSSDNPKEQINEMFEILKGYQETEDTYG